MEILKLLSETKKQKTTCKGCVFDVGSKKSEKCADEDFVISSKHGFEGGCDNPKKVSGIFVFVTE